MAVSDGGLQFLNDQCSVVFIIVCIEIFLTVFMDGSVTFSVWYPTLQNHSDSRMPKKGVFYYILHSSRPLTKNCKFNK